MILPLTGGPRCGAGQVLGISSSFLSMDWRGYRSVAFDIYNPSSIQRSPENDLPHR